MTWIYKLTNHSQMTNMSLHKIIISWNWKHFRASHIKTWMLYYIQHVQYPKHSHVCTSLNLIIEGKPRCAALTCLCTNLFIFNALAYTEQSPVSLLLHLKSLRLGDVLPSYWWTMVSPKQLRLRRHGLPLYQRYMRHCSVSALVRMMACCLFGSRPSSESMLVYC